MPTRGRWLGGGVLILLGVSGCPLTDDYYLLPGSPAQTGGSSGGGTSQAGGNQGGSSGGTLTGLAGAKPAMSGAAGTPSAGGAPSEGGDAGQAGAGASAACVPETERCNGRDDDCDQVLDDSACPDGCSGFVLDDPEHGYRFCTGNLRRANWSNAATACGQQGQHLVRIESASENAALASALDARSADTAVYIGASDVAREGDWVWSGGDSFWLGGAFGSPVGGAFEAWRQGRPDNNLNNEDCGTLELPTGSWDDRTCTGAYSYVCEDP